MSPVLIMLTLAANAKYLHRIPGRSKVMLLSQVLLKSFNLVTGHFDNPAAFDAN